MEEQDRTLENDLKGERKKRPHRKVGDSTRPGACEGFEWRAVTNRGPGGQANPEIASREALGLGEDKAIQGCM